jgi:hypothetical protein
MWKLLIRIEGQKEFHTVFGAGMPFGGFHILDQAASFMLRQLDGYITSKFGPDADVAEVVLKFEDKRSRT